MDVLRAQGEKLRAIVGKDTLETLSDFAKVEAVRAKSSSSGGMAGQLVYSNILSALMDFKIGEVPRIVRNRLIAGALTTPGVKSWLSQTTLIPKTPLARAMVFSSPPILRAAAEEFRDEPDMLGQVLDAAAFGRDASSITEPTANEAEMLKFLQADPVRN